MWHTWEARCVVLGLRYVLVFIEPRLDSLDRALDSIADRQQTFNRQSVDSKQTANRQSSRQEQTVNGQD